MTLRLVIFILSVGVFSGCKKDAPVNSQIEPKPYKLAIPEGFPLPEIPDDNPLTTEKIALGKRLFNDPILSRDSTISCGSCHFQEFSFSDGKQFSTGINNQQVNRNAPALTNMVYEKSLFRDGGAPTLELQILAPLDNPLEMDLPIFKVTERLQQDEEYVSLFKAVFGSEPNAFGITRAISAYERTLISGNSRYDQYTFQGNDNALTKSEIRGMELFFSDSLNCSSCHSGFNFTSNSFENNGIYLNYTDKGRGRITLKNSDNGKFKIPSIRNINVTAPYMHDGSFVTLNEVIDHYANGGKNHVNQSQKIKGFVISEQEKQDLINFLGSLTDYEFLTNPDL